MASVRKRATKNDGDHWVVNWTDHFGKRRLKTFHEHVEARNFRAKVRKDPAYSGKLTWTVGEICERYMRVVCQRQRDGEIRRAQVQKASSVLDCHIAPYLAKLSAAKLTPMLVQDWIEQLRAPPKSRSANVIREAVGFLSQALSEAQRLGIVTRNVIREAPPRTPKVPTGRIAVPSLEQVRAVLAVAQQSANQDARLLIPLAVLTGLRQSEIFGLQWKHIEFEKRVLKVRQTVDAWGTIAERTKTAAGRRNVPLPPILLGQLRDLRRERQDDREDALIFYRWAQQRTSRGKLAGRKMPYSQHKVSLLWRRILVDAGCQPENLATPVFRFHSLRHVAASLLIAQGLPPKRIQTIMGHASIQMTFDRYGHILEDDGAAHVAASAIEAQILIGGEVAHGDRH